MSHRCFRGTYYWALVGQNLVIWICMTCSNIVLSSLCPHRTLTVTDYELRLLIAIAVQVAVVFFYFKTFEIIKKRWEVKKVFFLGSGYFTDLNPSDLALEIKLKWRHKFPAGTSTPVVWPVMWIDMASHLALYTVCWISSSHGYLWSVGNTYTIVTSSLAIVRRYVTS